MVLILGVGIGTFLLLFFLALLLLILALGHKSPIGQRVFWIGLVAYILVFLMLFGTPTEDEDYEQDIVEKWYVPVLFTTAATLGIIVNIIAYLFVVLLYQDYATVIPT